MKYRTSGFTIVELLIVIVVIGILAAIVIMGYNRVQENAIEVGLKSDIDGSTGIIEQYKLKNGGTYPSDSSVLNGGQGLKASNTNVLEYVSIGTAYCVSARSERINKIFHYLSTDRKIVEGPCVLEPANTTPVVSTVIANLDHPTGIVAPSTEVIYVVETGKNRVLKVTADGSATILAGSTSGLADFTNGTGTAARFNAPHGIGADSYGNLYVADQGNHSIRKVTQAGVVSTLAGNGTSGSADGTGSAARFWDPFAVSVNPATNAIYASETGNHRVRQISATGTVSLIAGSTNGFTDGVGSAARFHDPLGLAFYEGNIYVADWSNNVIRQLTISTKEVSTLLGSSTPSYVDGVGTAARFRQPTGIGALDGKLYIADSGNHRVRVADIATKTVSTYGGQGVDGYQDGSIDSSQFSYPTGVAIGPQGTIYIVETNAGRIRKIQ
ncbi:MAG: prepilin-type N-terminal cleavage/methylation domain-containing protein [Candidatus Microsaccharimonas sp.]